MANEANIRNVPADSGDAVACIAAGMGLAQVRVVEVEGVPHLARHRDVVVTDMEDHLPAPIRANGSRHLASPEAFLAYVDRHASAATVVYGDRTQAQLVAVVNDHAPGASPGWRDHRAVLQAEASEAWKAWKPMHRKAVPQAAFCDFLEDHLPDVQEPAGADLLELLRDLRGRKDVAWSSGVNLDNGDVQLSYQEETTAESSRKGAVVIPKLVTLAIEVFRGVPHYKMPCRLRYRIQEGRLFFILVIDQIEEIEEAAFRDLLELIRKGLPDEVILLEGKAG